MTGATPVEPPARSPLRLVLVEDSDAHAAILEQLLGALPDAPSIVRFGRLEEALRHLAHIHADCVVLDVDLPDARGADGVLRILEVAPAMALVVLTGDDDEDLGLRLLRAGAQDRIVKGEETGPALLRAIRHAVERNRTGDRHEAERLVRQVEDDSGRLPERRLTEHDRRRDMVAGAVAVLACAALQLLAPSLGGVSVLFVLAVAWLAARVGLAAGLTAAAAAIVSLSLRDVIASDALPISWSLGVRVGGFAAAAVVSWRMTRRLRRSDELLHGILTGTTDAIAVKDLAGRYLLANDASLDILGHPREAVLGRTDAELLPPDVAGPRRLQDEAVLASGGPRRYWRTAAYADGRRTHSVVKVPYRDGQGRIVGLVSVARDETEMRRLEEETGRFFDLAPDMLCTIAPSGHLERLNGAWTRVLGWTDDELRSRPLRDFVDPEDAAAIDELVAGTAEVCRSGIATRGGGRRDVEWSARREADGSRVHAVVRDVSERTTMERRLADTEARYRELVHTLPGAAVLTFDHDLRVTFAAGEALEAVRRRAVGVGETLGQSSRGAAQIAPRCRGALAGQA
ncbi:MAG: hypothetical protein QOD06_3565, partial [Candidatus Binatota bacterium]|nr:hypothetical protein [Candidatus Binatota bacterium]